MKRALLANPPTGRYIRSDRCQAPVDTRIAEPARPPMDLASMAAVLEDLGWTCRIRDYPMENVSWEAVKEDLRLFRPDLLVVSTTTPTIRNDLALCELAKGLDPAAVTVAKGAHLLVFDAAILRDCPALDIAIRGETEVTLREIALGRDLGDIDGISFRRNGEIVRTPDRAFLDDLDALPPPARHLVKNDLYRAPDSGRPMAFVATGRGCPGRCVFCPAGLVGGHAVRHRSVDAVILEIEDCIRRFAITEFYFAADTFTWDRQWVVTFCRRIIEKRLPIRWGANSRVDTIDEERLSWMKNAGCYVVGFGAESASPEMLAHMKKDVTVAQIERAVALCERLGVKSYLHFVIGLPWETPETLAATIRFAAQTRASFLEVNIAYPLPGTPFFAMAKEHGLFLEEELHNHDHTAAIVRSFALTTQELCRARKKILRAFYLRPRYLFLTLSGLRSPGVALRYLRYGLRLLRNLART